MGKNYTGGSYSTQHGDLCMICFKPKAKCTCKAPGGRSGDKPSDGVVRVARSTKGRKGAGVTTITGLPGKEAEWKALAKDLKKLCGSGGTLRDGVIEIQGEHRDRIVTELVKRGIQAKKAGG